MSAGIFRARSCADTKIAHFSRRRSPPAAHASVQAAPVAQMVTLPAAFWITIGLSFRGRFVALVRDESGPNFVTFLSPCAKIRIRTLLNCSSSSPVKLVLLIALLLPSAALAQALQWEKTRTPVEAAEGGGTVTAYFRFTNTSDQPVRIRSVPTSCGCMVGMPEKRDYAPGEQGSLALAYSPKGRQGVHAYRFYVVTDEKGVRPYELVLEVTETPRQKPRD